MVTKKVFGTDYEWRTETETPYDRMYMVVNADDGTRVVGVHREDGTSYVMPAENYDWDKQKAVHYSEPYEYNGKNYRYDYTNRIVIKISRPTEDMIRDNEEWKAEGFKTSLWPLTSDGWYHEETVGLAREHWEDHEVRDEYLAGWQAEDEENLAYMMEDLKREFGF